MQLTPYLHFDGRCETAFQFYAQCLRGDVAMMMRYGESPMADKVSPESRDKIMHARLVAGDTLLMGCDNPDGYEAPKGFSVSIGVTDPAEAERVFHALAEHGTVQMPIQQTFWSPRFGMLVDQFGIPWMINCEQPPTAPA